jgi:hypothetical protein
MLGPNVRYVLSLDEFVSLIKKQNKKIIVSLDQINLTKLSNPNIIFLFELQESYAAGGRSAGFGQRSPDYVYCFVYKNGLFTRIFKSNNRDIIDKFELPGFISRLPIVLPDGSKEMVYGVVDVETINLFSEIINRYI